LSYYYDNFDGVLDISRTTDAATEPVTTDEAKTQLRLSGSAVNTEVDSMIKVARQWAENYCNRSFITQTWTLYLHDFPKDDIIYLPYGRLAGVTSIKYSDGSQFSTTLNSSNYEVVTTDRGYVYSDPGFPSTDSDYARSIEVIYTAGYGAASDVPQGIKQAILVILGDLWEFRQSRVKGQVGFMGEGSPFSMKGQTLFYEEILRPYKIHA